MNLKPTFLGAAAFLAMGVSSPAHAVTNFFTNFDSLAVASGTYTIVQSLEGWTATAGAGIEVQNNIAGTPFSQSNLVELDSDNNSTMSRMIDPGKYTLTLMGSGRPGIPASSSVLEILLNGSLHVTDSLSGIGFTDTNWRLGSTSFTVFAPTQLSLRAAGTNDSFGIYIDDVRLSGSAIPEPATWAMMLAGFGLIGSAMRRRKPTVAIA